MQDGWSLKKLHRVLMLSSVYQQKSDDNLRHEKFDPDNRLLAKTNRRRLDFESMRDTLLFVAGNLDHSFGGRPVDLLKRGTANEQPYSDAARSMESLIATTCLLGSGPSILPTRILRRPSVTPPPCRNNRSSF